uniref:Uncharacterized protein n=1 Tax=viral metagenome TaxID=1070528 RepID=A0A6C0ACK8_9ZZZZ
MSINAFKYQTILGEDYVSFDVMMGGIRKYEEQSISLKIAGQSLSIIDTKSFNSENMEYTLELLNDKNFAELYNIMDITINNERATNSALIQRLPIDQQLKALVYLGLTLEEQISNQNEEFNKK